MRILILISVILISGIGIASLQQQVKEAPGPIVAAIQKGDSRELSKYFQQSIELDIPGFADICDKAQAEMIMRDFFSKNPPKSFKINSQGSSVKGSTYFVGTYTTAKQSFKVYCLIISEKGKTLVKNLQFE